ncbi:MAG: hypothetical protein AAGE05_06555 [Pseudomonadota bacterium]
MHRRIRTVLLYVECAILMAFILFGIAQAIWETVLPRVSAIGLAVIACLIAGILILSHWTRGDR